ncbi:MAG: TrmH family RNA methyltransferase [Rikenellaceae bacterium]|nr:TrmH family RNA methyltransferase [Rikenellaceae bacterium]MCL2692431.1 TrmH family RNA methyltransferase [Rikenellaceae bacterium]
MKKKLMDELGRATGEEFAAARKMPVVVVLDNVRSMNNVGSFFRTCDAFAVEELVLCGITGTPPAAEIHKTALGAESTVAWRYAAAAREAVEELAAQGFVTLAVEQAEGAVMLNDFAPDSSMQGYALVFGNEVNGVGQEVVDACAGALEIPQVGTKHSLNVAVAGGIVLWSFFKQTLCR